MSIGSEYWRKEVESLKNQLCDKTEELENLKRYFDFNQESLDQLRNKLESCPVSGEVTLKLKGNYHTFFKVKINHPNYSENDMKDCSEKPQASNKEETPNEKEPVSKGEVKGCKLYYKNPVTGKIVELRRLTKYEELESKYNAQRDINKRLLHRAATQKSENEILRGKVNDLDHKLRQACQERDKLAEKLYRAEVEVQRYGLFLKKLSHLIYEETRC